MDWCESESDDKSGASNVGYWARLHMRTVEAEFVRTIATSRNLLEQTLPKQALRPSVVTRFRPKIREQTGFETSPLVN